MNALSLFLTAALPYRNVPLASPTFAQDTTFWDGEWRRVNRANAVYYGWVTVLDSAHSVVHNFYRTGEREMEAVATPGAKPLKNGPVTYYYFTGPKRATGQFVDNKREGLWQYWQEDGSLRLQKQFMKGIEVQSISEGTTDDSRVRQIVEQMPVFPGGISVQRYLASAVRRPVGAFRVRGDGKVFVQFVVSPQGDVTSTRIIKGFDPVYDAEALRAVAALPRWQPGFHNGRPVAVRFVVPVVFR
jgi:TonB family protein